MSDITKFVKSFQIIMLKKLSTAADEEEIRKKQITELNEKVRIFKFNINFLMYQKFRSISCKNQKI